MRLIFLLLLLTFSVNLVNAQNNINHTNILYYNKFKTDKKLYLKKESKEKQIKQNAILALRLRNGIEIPLAVFKMVNDSGLYISPYKKFDSTHNDSFQEIYIHTDTIVYYKFSEISSISYRNKLKQKLDLALLTTITGELMVIMPLILNPLIVGNYKYLLTKPQILFMGTGAAFTGLGYYYLNNLQRLKFYNMEEWNFQVRRTY